MNGRIDLQVVTLGDGDDRAKAVRDSAGRIWTREQMHALRNQQQAEIDQVTQLRDKLAANDAAAQAEIVGLFKDRLAVCLAAMARQANQMQEMRAKLEAGDAQTVASVVGQMQKQLAYRVDRLVRTRQEIDALLAALG